MTFGDPTIDAFFGALEVILANAPAKSTRRRRQTVRHTAMLAKVYQGDLPGSYACEPKIDGIRVIVTADLDRKAVRFETRTGNSIPSLAHLSQQVIDLLHGQSGIWTLDAEATSGTSFFDGIGRLRGQAEATDALLHVFDLPDNAGDYDARRAVLVDLFAGANVSDIVLVESLTDLTPEEAFAKFRAEGREGAMVKDRKAVYRQGVRSSSWLKVKDGDTDDCEVLDVVEGEGRCVGMAGHVVVRFCGKVVKVGTGMDDATRRDLLANRASIIGQVAEIDFNAVTPKGSMRHPVFVRVRADK